MMEGNKKKILAAALFAGAVSLPAAALAGVVTGNCADCHTMHNSEQGAVAISGSTYGDAAENALINKSGGCIGCHAGGANVTTTGKTAGAGGAPQVDNSGATTRLAGGWFGATEANEHNPAAGSWTNDATLGTTPPGVQAGVTLAEFGCQNCHGALAHHDPDVTGPGMTYDGINESYRMLQADYDLADAPEGTLVSTAGAASATYGVGDNSVTLYDSGTINQFCADCHGDFHGTTNQGGPSSPWVRHPTDIAMPAGYLTAYNVHYDAVATNKVDAVVPLGDVTYDATPDVTAGEVMCISCHRPHGSDVADLLRFAYDASNNVAGGSTQSIGCETCHGAK